jgi:putative endonuclease
MYYVYVLKNLSTGKHYTGQTSDLEKRLQFHNDSANRLTMHTKRNPAPWVLVYHEERPDRSAAMAREKYLKSGLGREYLKKRFIAPGC